MDEFNFITQHVLFLQLYLHNIRTSMALNLCMNAYSFMLNVVMFIICLYHHFYSCWLSESKGTIWAFVAPMLLIILVRKYILWLALIF